MRTLSDILEDVKSGGKPDYDELYYSVLAMEALMVFNNSDMRRLTRIPGPIIKMTATESFRRFKEALEKNPKEWVGWNNDPGNPEFQKRRQAAISLVKKIAGG